MIHFTNFCTDCGVFDTLTFTPEENAKIKRFDETVTAVWEKARQGTTAYDDCKANILGAAILCPEDSFRNVVFDYTDDNDYADMEQVAKHFNIPLSVAKTFGRQLNIIPYEPTQTG